MTSALQNADYLAEYGWGRVRDDIQHGHIVQYFSNDRPDRQGRFGYGFIAPDNGSTINPNAESVWFMASKGYFMRAAPSGSGLNWTYRHFIATRTFSEPKIGDTVVFEQRPSWRHTSGYETGCWTYEQEYVDALADLGNLAATQ